MDYSQLVSGRTTAGSIKNWINRDTVDPDTVLLDAQQLVWASLRHWKMKCEAYGTMTVGRAGIDLPADFLDCNGYALQYQGVAGNGVIRKGDSQSVHARWQFDGDGNFVTGQPQWWYLRGALNVSDITTLRLVAAFDVEVDQAYDYVLIYYLRPALLSVTNSTNFLTTDMPRLLRSACMLVAVEFEKEVGQGQFDRTYWQQQFDKQLGDQQRQSDRVDADKDSGPDFGDYCP